MKSCVNCKHAEWQRTAAGKLHPSGEGRCGFEYKLPPLPASMRWGFMDGSPVPGGGRINRREELPSHCVHFARVGQ